MFSGAPVWEKNTAVLNGDRYFSMPSAKTDSAVMDPLLKPNEEYAQVVSFPRLSFNKKDYCSYVSG